MGDNLLLSGILPELKKQFPDHKLVIESDRWRELFKKNPFVDWATDQHIKTTRRHIKPKYKINAQTQESIYLQIGKIIGIEKEVYPQIYLEDDEIMRVKNKFNLVNDKKKICFCPVGKQGFSANRKEWGKENFQRLIFETNPGYQWFQIGVISDPLMQKVTDARHLNIRETAALLQLTDLFVGLEGGLMHLAKAVSTPAVIIYGGVIHPKVSGYQENENIYSQVDCSPCFRSDKPLKDCVSMKCMKSITVDQVKDKIKTKIGNNYEN